jgi:electron transfer flavoprotein alpha subunit
MSDAILVVAEHQDGRLNRASLEAVAAAQQIGAPVKIVVPGAATDDLTGSLAAAEVAEVILLDDPALGTYTPDAYVAAVASLVAAETPALVMVPHTYRARDWVPRLAARLDRAIVTDCIGLKAHGNGHAFTRPMFQGKVHGDVVLDGPAPHFVTWQVGAFRADSAAKGNAPAPVRQVKSAVDAAAIRQKPEAPFREAKQAVDLSQAERIVAVGRGIKGKEHLAVAEGLAAVLGAELAASRPICDAGWLPMERQVGSSGQTVAPKLYIALGISGAIQHVVGMKGARTIVAINKDAEAPIFELADYGIAGDLFEIVPAIVAALKA